MRGALGLLAFFLVLLVVGFEVFLYIRHWFEEDEPGSGAKGDHSLLGDALRTEERLEGSHERESSAGSATNESRES